MALAYAEGIDPYGSVTQVYCGPDDMPDQVYDKLIFRVTLRPDKTIKIRPWAD